MISEMKRAITTGREKEKSDPIRSSSPCRGGWAFYKEGALVDRKEVMFTAEIMESVEKREIILLPLCVLCALCGKQVRKGKNVWDKKFRR